MKTLLFMRHAKSSWGQPATPDHERPLNARGQRDAPFMAQKLVEHGQIPELILCSDAQRTRETSKAIQAYCPHAEIHLTSALYLASARELIDQCTQLPENIQCALLLAHNPGITNVINLLAHVRLDNAPTSSIACVAFETDHWSKLTEAAATLQYFIYPKKYQ